MADETDLTLQLTGSMDPALLPDITTSDVHIHRSDGSVGMVEKANSGRMSPIRKRSVKDVEQQIEGLEKENFDLKLRIYFLEQQKGINKDDTLKVNIDLRVQLQSIHQEFQKKQETWEQMMSGYDNHIEELEQQINKDRCEGIVKEAEELRSQLQQQQRSLAEMESLLNEKAFESETQLQSANSEIDRLKKCLSDRERQLITSPTQEELLSVKQALDEKHTEIQDKNILLNTVNQQVTEQEHQLKQLVTKLNQTTQILGHKEEELNVREAELSHKEAEIHAVREELNQKDFSLRKAQIDLQGMSTQITGQQAELERHKAEVSNAYNQETQTIIRELEAVKYQLTQKDAVLVSKDAELSARDNRIREKDLALNNLNDSLNQHRQQIQMLNNSVSGLRNDVKEKELELQKHHHNYQLLENKFKNEVNNIKEKMTELERAVRDKDSELEKLSSQLTERDNITERLKRELRSQTDSLSALHSATEERDRTISSLTQGITERDKLISQLQTEIQQLNTRLSEQLEGAEPQSSSTPRDSGEQSALTRLCIEIEHMKKENVALREGRPPMDYLDDQMDIDGLSDTSDTRDYLHSQLAKNNARASAIQTKLLEMSREEVDGGSESSSLLREQISALNRMRESDKRVMEALKKHISLNHGGEFDPSVISTLAEDVFRLSQKMKDMHKKGQRSERSGRSGSRSARSGGSSTTSSVYREEIDHLRRELDQTRHEASKAAAEVHKLSEESAVVSKLQATEALVRQQADEKKKLIDKLAYYKSLLEAAGLLPPSPPVERAASVENLSLANSYSADQSQNRRTSRIPRRSSSTPRLNASSRERSLGAENRKQSSSIEDDSELQEHLQGVMFRQKHMTPDKIREAMQKMGDKPSSKPGLSKIPTFGQSTQSSPSKAANQSIDSGDGLRALVTQYREEVQQFGRPVELKQKLDKLSSDLNKTQDELNRSLEYNQQLEQSYEDKLFEKDEVIEDLEDKIEQLEARLRALSGAPIHDTTEGSVTLELVGGSRPPSSLHSVPQERASSRVVSLCGGGGGAHDRSHQSSSGVAGDRSTLSFSGSAPGADTSLNKSGPLVDMNKSGNTNIASESGIVRSSRPSSSGGSSTIANKEEAESRAAVYSPEEEISPIQSRRSLDHLLSDPHYSKTLSPLHEVSSGRDSGRDAPPALSNGVDRGVKSQARSSSAGSSRSLTSLVDPLDSTVERMRRDASMRYTEPPSLGGTLGDPIQTQDDLLNTSSEAIPTLPMEKHVRRLFSVTDSVMSPEKGPVHSPIVHSPTVHSPTVHSPTVHSPTVHSPQTDNIHSQSLSTSRSERSRSPNTTSPRKQRRLDSPVKVGGADQATDRYEKQMSPTRGLLENRPQARSWQQAANGAYPDQPMTFRQPLEATGKSGLSGGLFSERPLSAASTQTEDTEELVELSGRLVKALNKESTLGLEHHRLGEIHRQYEAELRSRQQEESDLRYRLTASQQEGVELRSQLSEVECRLSEAENEIDDQMQKRLETAETATSLQKQLTSQSAVIEKLTQRYEGELRSSEGQVQTLNHQLKQTKDKMDTLRDKLRGSEAELSEARHEITSAHDSISRESNKYKEAAQQLRETKEALKSRERELSTVQRDVGDSQSKLGRAERDLRASQTELRINKEELDQKTENQVEMTKKLRQLETEREALTQRLAALQQLQPSATSASPASSPYKLTAAGDRQSVRPSDRPSDRPSAVRRLQDEITSILDTSDIIKTNIASALEQSRLNDTRVGGAADGDGAVPAHTASDRNNLIELLKLNLMRVENLNLRIAELLSLEKKCLAQSRLTDSHHADLHLPSATIASSGVHENYKSASQTLNGTAADEMPTHSQSLPVSSQLRDGLPYRLSPGVERASQSLQPSDSQRHLTSHQWAESPVNLPANRSQNNAEDLSANHSAPQLSMPNQGSFDISPNHSLPFHLQTTNQTGPNNTANLTDLRTPNMQLHSSAPEQVTINGITYQQVPESANQTAPASVHYQQAPAADGTGYWSPQQGHPGRHHSPPSRDHTLTGDRSRSPQRSPVKHDTLDHPQRQTITESYRPPTTQQPVHQQNYEERPQIPSDMYHQSGALRPGMVTQPPQHSSTPVFDNSTNTRAGYTPPSREEVHRTSPQAITNVYESVEQSSGRELSRLTGNIDRVVSTSLTDLPSTRGPLYAISDLVNYELLKKHNEESLVILSGLEARVQSRLDRLPATSPLDNVEWCTLKELKSCVENLRRTLFSEKKYITKFYIRELPDGGRSDKFEETLRAYKKLEARYDWAKTQLKELMRATQFDGDLVNQMKRVKSILKASKENVKSRAFSADRLGPSYRRNQTAGEP